MAYFSITFKEFELNLTSQSISKTQLKMIDGFSKAPSTARGYLLAQIGKNTIKNNPINADTLFAYTYEIIHNAWKYIGGRILLLECKDDEKLKSIYKSQGFIELQTDEYVLMFNPLRFE